MGRQAVEVAQKVDRIDGKVKGYKAQVERMRLLMYDSLRTGQTCSDGQSVESAPEEEEEGAQETAQRRGAGPTIVMGGWQHSRVDQPLAWS